MAFEFSKRIKHLYGALHLVPFEMIEVSDPNVGSEGYQFSNPRLMTEQGQTDLMDLEMSSVLREDIKNKTLRAPLICRVVDGEKIQLGGGERRYRSLSYLIDKNEFVKDPSSVNVDRKGNKEYSYKLAGEVYKDVLCQIYNTESDIEALAYSYSENACRKNLNDGHDVAILMELRRHKATDDQILSVLQKNKMWLRDTDSLVKKLDPATLNELLEGRITRQAAAKLSEIDDIDDRTEVREKAGAVSDKRNSRNMNINQKRIERAAKDQHVAQINLRVAETLDSMGEDHCDIEKVTEDLKLANTNVADAFSRQNDGIKPMLVEDIEKVRVPGDNPTSKFMKRDRIKHCYLDFLAKICKTGSSEDGSFTVPTTMAGRDAIRLAMRIAKGIHDGDENCLRIVKKSFKK